MGPHGRPGLGSKRTPVVASMSVFRGGRGLASIEAACMVLSAPSTRPRISQGQGGKTGFARKVDVARRKPGPVATCPESTRARAGTAA